MNINEKLRKNIQKSQQQKLMKLWNISCSLFVTMSQVEIHFDMVAVKWPFIDFLIKNILLSGIHSHEMMV